MDKMETLRKKIKWCNVVSITAFVLIAVCFLVEFLLGQFMADRAGMVRIVNNIGYFCYVLPFVALIPQFFRVNFTSKLMLEQKKQQEQGSRREDGTRTEREG